MSQLPPDLAQLSPAERRELLAKLLQQRARDARGRSSPRSREPRSLDGFAVPVAELAGEAVLDPAIRPDELAAEPPSEPAHVLLTGATGFLGAFLLVELLRRTEAAIHCLVRCGSVEEGIRRIDSNLQTYAPGHDYDRSRVVPIGGDLSLPLLGLTREQFDALGTEIDWIYHNGAAVNWIYPYSRLKPSNVLGTHEIVRLASHLRLKPVHLISSASVFPLVVDARPAVVREQDSLDHGGVLYGGYTQSKWVAEKIATIARGRGLPVTVYRPGIISGHSESGSWNTDDFMPHLIKSWIELGSAPDLDGATDMTPVDYVSRAVVHLSLSADAAGNVFHLINPQRVHLREVVAAIRASGYRVEQVGYDRWRAELLARAERSTGRAGYSLLPLFSASGSAGNPGGGDQLESNGRTTVDQIGSIMAAQYAARSVEFDDRQARAGLAGSSITCPRVDGDVLARYLAYLALVGSIPAPVP
jgi:thioester reductase-like protein